MYATRESHASDDIEIAALLRAVGRRKSWIAFLAVAAGIATYVVLTFVTPLYTSQTRILIEREDNFFKSPVVTSLQAEQPMATDQGAIESQVQVLLSHDLAIGVMQDLKLVEDPEFNTQAGSGLIFYKILHSIGLQDALGKTALQERVLNKFMDRLDVYQLKRSRMIAVSFQSENPETAAKVANKLAEFYLTWQQSEKIKQTKEASVWLSTQIGVLTKKVQAADIAAERFRSSSGLLQGTNNVTLDAQELSELSSQLILAKAQRTEAEARASLIRKMLKDKGDVASAADVINSRLIQRLLEQRVRVQRELAEVSTTLLPSHPRIKQLNSELSDLQRRIRQEARKVVTSLQNEAQIAGAREASLRESLTEMKQIAAKGNESQIKLRALEREAKANRDILESYLSRYRDASSRGDQESVPAHASIVSRAHISNIPSFPKKGPIALLAAAAVALLGLAHTIARELIYAQRAIPRAPYADQQARYGANHDAAQITPDQPFLTVSSFRELVRQLKSKRAKRIVMSSISGGAESAQQTIETARALARSGARIILVDATPIGDNIAIAMDMPNTPGLHHLLSRSASLEDAVRRDPETSLHLISGGSETGQLQAIDPASLAQLVEALEGAYDQVMYYCDPAEAKSLIMQSCQSEPSLVLVADTTSTHDNAKWLADTILAEIPDLPSVTLLKANATPGWSLPQMPGWKRAAAV